MQNSRFLPQGLGAPDARSIRCVEVGWSTAPPHARRGRKPLPHTHMLPAGARQVACVFLNMLIPYCHYPCLNPRGSRKVVPRASVSMGCVNYLSRSFIPADEHVPLELPGHDEITPSCGVDRRLSERAARMVLHGGRQAVRRRGDANMMSVDVPRRVYALDGAMSGFL